MLWARPTKLSAMKPLKLQVRVQGVEGFGLKVIRGFGGIGLLGFLIPKK